jgi:hypothetical protein
MLFHSRGLNGRVLAALLWNAAEARSAEEVHVARAPCGEGVVLSASDAAPTQGRIAVVEVRSETPLVSVDGFFAGEQVHFWQETDARVFQALVGVDLHERPGAAALRARVVPGSGPELDCRLELRIVDGDFPVQRLTVAPRYVDPSPEDAARAQRETAELRRIFSSASPERLWQGGFRAPVPGHEPSGSFGRRRVLNGQPRSPHSGEDFSAPE